MKRLVLFLILSYAFIFNAQTQVSDSSNFVSEAPAFIAKMVFAFMQDYHAVKNDTLPYKSDKIERGRALDTTELTGMAEFDRLFVNPQVRKVSLDSIRYFIEDKNKGWNSNGAKVFNGLNRHYSNLINKKNYHLHQIAEIDAALLKIPDQNAKDINQKVFWKQRLAEYDHENKSIAESSLSPRAKKARETNEPVTRNISLTPINFLQNLLIFISGLVLGGFISYKMVSSKNRSKLNEEKKRYKRKLQEKDSLIEDKENSFFKLQKEKKELVITNEDLLRSIEEYENQPKLEQGFSAAFKGSIKEERPPVINHSKAYYFDVPDPDGTFLISHGRELPEQRSYYKIISVKGRQEAELVYNQGVLDASAISQSDLILKPVCKIENPFDDNTSDIRVLSTGTVFKVDGKWKVQEKIKIKLI